MMMQIQDISKRKTMQEKYILHQDLLYYFAQGKHGEHIEDASLFRSICMELLPLISCPTLIIHGEKDPMVPNFHPQYLLKHIKGSQLHLMPEGKHNLHLRYADEFNKLVEDFLED
ncbi:hypothetical protein F7725_028077 [Dissostichus mawsoni]|uniref:AB hydrolase-1 domain-containing protein n=1 Tax=Dissostichus mawsoni TaxID=36200 RepID=A0A7J5XFP9_DISMA|nr:hypothetical protein F7725_028077 [Dissostichus mawsoni]